MVGVGFAAPTAMSTTPETVAIAMVISTFFAVTAVVYTLLAAATAFTSMLHYGTHKEAGPTLMVIVPIVTILSILFLRQGHGLHATFDVHASDGETLVFLARMLSIQLIFLALPARDAPSGVFQRFRPWPQNLAPAPMLWCVPVSPLPC